MNRCWHGEPMLRPHIGELEISLRAIYDRFAALLTTTTVSDDGASSQPASSSNEDFAEIDANESLTTDSDYDVYDFDELTLQ